MTKKREPEIPVESESESEEESAEGSDESEPEPTVATGASKKPQPEDSESSDGEEEEREESESEEDDDVKPANSGPTKPVEPTPTKLTTPVKRPAAAEPQMKDSKKAKTRQNEVENSEKKPTPFQRLWSEEDKIVLLKGMIEYAAKKKADPVADLNAFLEFIKKNIHVDVTKTQLQDKIRRLRKKYGNNKSKENSGKDMSFLKSHELEAYELSKEIWDDAEGKVNVANGGTMSSSKNKKKADVEEAKAAKEEGGNAGDLSVISVLKSLAGVGSEEEENLTRFGTMAFDGEEGAQWKELLLDEFNAYGALLDVRRKKVNMMVNYLNS